VSAPSSFSKTRYGGALTRKETHVSEDQNDQIERKEERPEEVEAHKFHEPDMNEEADVEGHVLEQAEQVEHNE
jgi:hypothetical protein